MTRIPKNENGPIAKRYTTDKLQSTKKAFSSKKGQHWEYAIYRMEGVAGDTSVHPTVTRQYALGGVREQFPNRLAMTTQGGTRMTWYAEDGTITAGPEVRLAGGWGCSDKNTEDPNKAAKYIKHECLETPTVWYCVFLYDLTYLWENVTLVFANPGDEIVMPDPEPGSTTVLALFEGKVRVGSQIRNAPFVADLTDVTIPTKRPIVAIEQCIGMLITNCLPREYDEDYTKIDPPDFDPDAVQGQ